MIGCVIPQCNFPTQPILRLFFDISVPSHLIHVVVDGDLEALPALRREPVVVHLGVQQDAQPVLLAQLDSRPGTKLS